MAKYYYEKWSLKSTTKYLWERHSAVYNNDYVLSWTDGDRIKIAAGQRMSLYSGVSINAETGLLTYTGNSDTMVGDHQSSTKYFKTSDTVATKYIISPLISNAFVYIDKEHSNITRNNFYEKGVYYIDSSYQTYNFIGGEAEGFEFGYWWVRTSTTQTTYSKGTTLYETFTAEEGTYPVNGRSGNYWYVRGEKAFPDMSVNINGSWKTAQDGWVNIDGVWRSISGIWTNIDGTWRQS